MGKFKVWLNLHKKGLTLTGAITILGTGIGLGAGCKELWVDMFAGGDIWATVATYSVVGILGFCFVIYCLWGKLFNRKGKKINNKAAVVDTELKTLELQELKKELKQKNQDIIKVEGDKNENK